MGMHRVEWECCGDVSETEAWEPMECPFCQPSARLAFQKLEQEVLQQYPDFLVEYLKMWKDSGVPAPLNEVLSIQAWLCHLVDKGAEATIEAMRMRLMLLQDAANKVNAAGKAEELGIYDNRPEQKP